MLHALKSNKSYSNWVHTIWRRPLVNKWFWITYLLTCSSTIQILFYLSWKKKVIFLKRKSDPKLALLLNWMLYKFHLTFWYSLVSSYTPSSFCFVIYIMVPYRKDDDEDPILYGFHVQFSINWLVSLFRCLTFRIWYMIFYVKRWAIRQKESAYLRL